MSPDNSGKNTAIIILVVILLLFAFRSIFFILPFGIFPGISHVFRDAGHAVGGWGPFSFIPFMIFPLALLALWIIIIVWVYHDAERRGMRSPILWTLLVLFGNILGLIIYLIVRNETPIRTRPSGPAQSAASSGTGTSASATPAAPGGAGAAAPCCGPAAAAATTSAPAAVKCPNCGKDVAAGFAFCPYCGAGLQAVCPNCRKPVDKGWKVCPHCGAALEPDKPQQA